MVESYDNVYIPHRFIRAKEPHHNYEENGNKVRLVPENVGGKSARRRNKIWIQLCLVDNSALSFH